MKTLRYALLLTLLSLSSIYNQNLAQKSSNNELKILTFNLRYGTANDGQNSWKFRKNMLLNLIKEENADVIGLQEALKMQLDEIKEFLPEYEQLGVGREDGKEKGEYSALLYKKSRLKMEDTGYFWFSDRPAEPNSRTWGNNVTRICTWALLNDNGKKFYFYNLHLDHESQNAREKSSEQLLKHLNGKNLPVIITGDFNAGEDNNAIKILLAAGFSDSFRKIRPEDKNVATYHDFKGTITGDKIDYILCTKEFKVMSAEIIRKNENGRYPSDHFPVNAVLKF